MTAKEVLKLLKQNGWYICETKGSHYQLKHLKIKRYKMRNKIYGICIFN
ncbi:MULTISPECIES: type II toxin-antitoxin system HicA family toxin [Treponema]|uniref:Conserved domain protein n=1 Tax=Treponema denticola (strain ATCC 35405 / DSM 14222 / CIP 103919 / JCM 8153 / KCTC 15104) TaxID=243275 RepID=Q73MX8_TREDE|nr:MULTISPECIES: type II toxin-antitoxin system HicA family toxin [Treponema]AAS11895.1 conserved domain protein [Treponema denticola ATCC 35405]HCY96146.1 addiction module toxin, HicA family [Treponema sp.]